MIKRYRYKSVHAIQREPLSSPFLFTFEIYQISRYKIEAQRFISKMSCRTVKPYDFAKIGIIFEISKKKDTKISVKFFYA